MTPVRPVVRNREVAARYEEPGSSSHHQQQQQQQQAASTQERVKHLQKEVRCVQLGLVLVVSGLGHSVITEELYGDYTRYDYRRFTEFLVNVVTA